MQWLQTQERMSWFTEVAILLLLFTPSGNATQFCPSNTTLDFSQCENVAIAMLRTIADELFPNVTVVDDETLAMALDIVNDLANLTQPTNCSIFPRDINTSNYIITNTVDFLYMHLDQGGATDITASAGVVEVIDNLLDWVNLAGFEDLQAGAPGSQSVLNNAERYALYLATALSQNGSERDILLSRQNIVIRSERLETNDTQLTDVIFPLDGDLQNFTISSGMSPAVITVPAQLMVQRTNSSTVAIAHIQFQNLQDFLPPELDNSLATPVSLIISSQVAVQSGGSMSSQTLEENPVMITFTVDGATDEDFTCVFWDFSEPIGSGGWSTEGVTAVQVMQDGNNTVVQCNSTHLTSFAVLRVMAGTAVNGPRRLRVIGYIGMAVSLACLLLTIIFFLSLGKKLFKEVHNFVHLNLAIALFVGYLTFCLGVELAATNKAACQTVSAIMQYFFLASFCWVLCEGIMSYLLLVLVFSSLSKQWWFFLILGWIPPIFFVVIGLATVLDEYVVYSRNGAGEILTDRDGNDIIRFCWLSAGNGTTAIWTFVAPILAIFVISCVFLILVLCSLYRYHRNRSSELKENRSRVKLAVSLLKATIILFPLLGLTWVLGIFVVNLNTQDVAVSVTVFNSLQGVFIFFLHVLRSERVWGRIKKKYHSSKHSKAGTHESAKMSGGKKANEVTNSKKLMHQPMRELIHNDDMAAVMISESTVDAERPMEEEANSSGGGGFTLEMIMKEKTGASFAYDTQFEPNDDTTGDDVGALMISEGKLSAARQAEEEVMTESDSTSDDPTSYTVETTALLTDYKGSVEVMTESDPTSDDPTSYTVETTALLTDYKESVEVKTKSDPTSDVLGPGNEARHTGDAVETTAAEAVLTDNRETVEVKTKSDPTSDGDTNDAVETTAAEAVLTDYRESVEVKTRSDPTSDEPTTDAVETTAAEAVLTDYRESVEGAVHPGGACVYSQPHLPKVRRDGVGATVRRKEFHTELLLRRNEELRNRMESVLGVAVSGITAAELIRDDILLCRLMNKLHPGMINHEETSAEKRIHNVAEFIAACKKLEVPEHKLCTAGDIIEGKNTDSVIACLEYLLDSSSP